MRDNIFLSLFIVGITISLFLSLFFPPLKAQISDMSNVAGPTNDFIKITANTTTKNVGTNLTNRGFGVIGINRTIDSNETSSIQHYFDKLIAEINGIRKSIDQSTIISHSRLHNNYS